MENLKSKVYEYILKNENLSVSDIIQETKVDIDILLNILNELEFEEKIILNGENIDVINVFTSGKKSYLDKFNIKLHNKTIETKKKVEKKREDKGFINFENYSIVKLEKCFFQILNDNNIIKELSELDLKFVDRNKFNSDITIKLPELLNKHKGQDYIKSIIPNVIDKLNNSYFLNNGVVSTIEQKGIYINISFSDDYLFKSIIDILDLGNSYGENNLHQGESIVIDYSSPNTAKHLHAGHIRSTIIGHILSNLYDANGYVSHRVNHLNDWGGFGYLIEGYQRWKNILPNFDVENDMLFFIYSLYRKGEKVSASEDNFNTTDEEKIIELKKYFGEFDDFHSFKKLFYDFIKASECKFASLEKGEKEEVKMWEQMVKWSIEDFDKFYNLLGIHQDYFVGESFYSEIGKDLILNLEKEGKVIFYDKEKALDDIEKLKIKLKNGNIHDKEFDSISGEIIYEVGQEQAEHFDKLFKSGDKIGIKDIDYTHIYHGFYVDEESKKKLSSRDGASNVHNLINESIFYFEKKYDGNNDFNADEVKDNSYKLAIGSIIFNDIKKDKKSRVLINNNVQKTCETFEKSGGAYIMYSYARSKSILSKYGKAIPTMDTINIDKLEDIEKSLINSFLKYPLIVKSASEKDNPAILAEYLLGLARNFSSFYSSQNVLNGPIYRLKILESYIQVLHNGMKLLHIEMPDRI